MNALLVIDIQNDFLPGGALPVAEGDRVVPVANRLMASGEFGLVVASQDYHPAGHRSFASTHAGRAVGERIEWRGLEQILWPDHCVQETPGASFASALNVERFDRVVRKGMDPDVDSYSAFYDNGQRVATGLTDLLRGAEVERVTVIGLALDVCVKFTALDAVRDGFGASVVLDGCAGVELNDGDCARAIAQMRDAGVEIIG